MLGMPGPLGTIVDLLAVMLGFGAIVFIHELGHFIAARWAGIRVLTFAVGFGPALVSFRKGVGFRKGSSIAEYNRSLQAAGAATASDTPTSPLPISHTEYRLSALPFGGYVQMLGQDDLDPTSVSSASDSYQNAPVWKRLIVISAGVVMNVILAAVLFVVVFMAGLLVQPPTIGEVLPDSPAAAAVYTGSDDSVEAGLRPGDTILAIEGDEPNRFESVILKAAMAKKGTALPITVSRPGTDTPLTFSVTPEKSEFSGLLDFGVLPPTSATIVAPRDGATQDLLANEFARVGAAGLMPGDTITTVNGQPVTTFQQIRDAFENSNGEPVTLTATGPRDTGGTTEPRTFTVAPKAALQIAKANVGDDEWITYEHLLGLVPVLTVAEFGEPSQGLEPGDIFKRIGSVEYPSYPAGIAEIRAHAGKPIELEVIRYVPNETSFIPHELITIDARVKPDGTVGFAPSTTLDHSYNGTMSFLARPPVVITPLEGDPFESPSSDWLARAGSTVQMVNNTPILNFRDLRSAITDAARSASPGEPIELEIEYFSRLTNHNDTRGASSESATWTISPADAAVVASLGWESPLPAGYFTPTQTLLKADDPIHAIGLGLDETKRVMASVYVTFLRLTQGSIEIQNIKGPVGIAHIGTMVADRGLIWMLFFLGMISVNLAVVNFLPLPIVDGGQFLMLVYEGIRGKPVPVAVQSVVMTAGLLLIASVFILVTFNDIKNLLGV